MTTKQMQHYWFLVYVHLHLRLALLSIELPENDEETGSVYERPPFHFATHGNYWKNDDE
ncbi:MAG: hypothetical protein ACRCYY_13450 [Trueperaceae bacterium]